MLQENLFFKKYGHECDLVPKVKRVKSWRSFLKTFRKKLKKMTIISEVNPRALLYLKNQGVIGNERSLQAQYPRMIHPFSDLRKYWEKILIWFLFFQFITVPIDTLGFLLPQMKTFRWTNSWKVFRTIMDLLNLVFTISNFFFGFYMFKDRIVVMNPWHVAIQYMRTYFFCDLLASIPLHLLLFTLSGVNLRNYYLINYSLKHLIFARFITYVRLIYHWCQHYKVSLTLSFIIVIIAMNFLYCLLCTSLLLYVMGLAMESDEKGIYDTNADGTRTYKIKGFINAIYQTTIIVTSSGYGLSFEGFILRGLVMFLWLLSRIVYIFLLSGIMLIFMARKSTTDKYAASVKQLKEYMIHKQLPQHMQRRLLQYYEFRFQKSYFREDEILNTIPGQLKQEIVMHSCRKLVENVAFFKNLPITLLVRIVSCLKSEIFLSNDIIIRGGSIGDCMYFISTGTVAVYSKSGLEICHLDEGAHFGEVSLVMANHLRIASVVAVEVCELYRFDRKDFVHAIHPYPDLLTRVQHIARDRMEWTEILDNHNRRENLQ